MRKTFLLAAAISCLFGTAAMAQQVDFLHIGDRRGDREDHRRGDHRDDRGGNRHQDQRSNRYYQSDRYSDWYHNNYNDRRREHFSSQGWRGHGWQSGHDQRGYRPNWYVRGNDWDRRWTGGVWVGGLWIGFDDPRLPSGLHGWSHNEWNPPRSSWGGRSCQRIVQRDRVHGRDAFVSYRVCVDPWGRRVASDPRFENWAF